MLNEADHETSQSTVSALVTSQPSPAERLARPTAITADRIDAAAAALRTLRPSKPLTTRDALVKLAPQIKAAQQRGCTLDQLSEQLRACGIDASVSSLRRSLREAGANGKGNAKAAP